MPLRIENGLKSRIVTLLKEARDAFKNEPDLGRALTKIPSIRSISRGLIDLAEDEDTRFAAVLVGQFLALLDYYEGKTEKWYETNRESVAALMRATAGYLDNLARAFDSKDDQGVVNATRTWFFRYHEITRGTTADVGE